MVTGPRVSCEGKNCTRSRSPRDNDPWPRWLCPECWAHVRVDTNAGICRLRVQLSRALKRDRQIDAHAITQRLFMLWDQAVSQARAGISRQTRKEQSHAEAAE